ncbi:MAG: proline dehydrogenase family protein [Desulfobacter sp.]|nr:MAG: proline dehydrogenase family protein [Desulfobacter sp.]
MEKSTAVRLVKGAFAEKPKIALQPGNAVDRAYLSLADRLLDPQAIEQGVFPVFATHDPILIKKIIAKAQARKISADQFEFEMLLGVRPELQKNLTNRNFQVRIYLPYGKDIWPYAIRRVGENPKNFKFLIKSILTAK